MSIPIRKKKCNIENVENWSRCKVFLLITYTSNKNDVLQCVYLIKYFSFAYIFEMLCSSKIAVFVHFKPTSAVFSIKCFT